MKNFMAPTLYRTSMVLAFVLLFVGTANADALYRQLDMGMSGTDISTLQTFLAQDKTLYPQGLITGYFGFLTQAAVSNFQSRNGIPAVGRVGPATLPVLNLQIGGGTANTTFAPIITSVSINSSRSSANVSWYTNKASQGVVYYSTSPLSTYENINSVTVSGQTAMSTTNFVNSQNVTLPNLQANTIYYYLIYTTDQSGNVSVTWPSAFQTTN